MCRLFAAISPMDRDYEEDLLYFRHLSSVHSDGWGLGWYEGGKPAVRKSSVAALYDPKYLTAARTIKSDMIMAHLRKQTRGNVREVNSHPFVFKNYMFAHNGTISKSLVRFIKTDYRGMKGDTDSELLMRFLIQHIEEHKRPLYGMRRAFRTLRKLTESGELKASAVNFLFSDGEKLYVYRKMYSRPMRLFYRYNDNGYESLQVSSAPLKTHDWVEMGDGEMLVADLENLRYRIFRVMY